MIGAGRLVNNTGFSFLSNFIRLGTNFLIFVFLARVLTIEEFGVFTFSFTFAMLFIRFSDFGIDRLSVIDISRNKALIKSYISNAMVIKAFLSLATFAIVWIIINAMGYPKNTEIIVYLFTISVIIHSYAGFLNGIFKGIERLEYETIVSFVINLMLIVLVFSTIALGYGVIGVGFSFIFSRLIGFIFALGVLRFKVEKISFHFDYSFSKQVIIRAFPFALFSFLSAAIISIDTILLSYMKGNQAVGYYQAAMKIIGTLTVIPFILDGSFFPLLSRLHDQNSEFEGVGKKLMFILFFIGMPFMTGLFALSDHLIVFVYGDGFLGSVLTFQILSFVLILRFSMKGYESILLAIDKQKTIFSVLIVATFINILLNVILIPIFSQSGAAVASICTHLLILASYIYITKKTQRIFMFDRSIALIILLSLLSGTLVYHLRSLDFIPLIIIFSTCYLGSTLLILKKERTYVVNAIRSYF